MDTGITGMHICIQGDSLSGNLACVDLHHTHPICLTPGTEAVML